MDTHRSQTNPSPSHSSCLMPRLICSYILWSVAFLMGVAWEGCPVVAELLGVKLFLNDGRRGVGRFQEAVDLCECPCPLPGAGRDAVAPLWARLRHTEGLLNLLHPVALGNKTASEAIFLKAS